MSSFTTRPFAFMRLTHEALRAGLASVNEAAVAGDLDAARGEYETLARVIALHARQEEEVFFPLLDELFDGAILHAGLRDAHEREHALQDVVEQALAAADVDALRRALEAWAPSFEAHLAEEEAVMMPLTQRVAPTVEGRSEAVGRILAVDWDALSTELLPYVVTSLHRTKPYGPLRMFVSAVQAAAGPRYSTLAPIIAHAVPTEVGARLRTHGHL